MDVALKDNRVQFGDRFSVSLHRTLRIPDDGRVYPLPPGFGLFPLRPASTTAPGPRLELIVPLYQREALWLGFSAAPWKPNAVKVIVGGVNAVSGLPDTATALGDPQDYLVCPDQPWLDGFNAGGGVIRQFVAMPLDDGYTAEEQLTGAAQWGGLQLLVYPMKAERYEALARRRVPEGLGSGADERFVRAPSPAMGLAPGGRMKQEIYDDPYDLSDWDQRHASRCFVTIVNSAVWTAIANERPSMQPPTAKDYTKAGLPWFDYYSDTKSVDGSPLLAKLKSVFAIGQSKGESPLPENESVTVERPVELGQQRANVVREASL